MARTNADMAMKDQPSAKRPKMDEEATLTHHFPLRDNQLRENLATLHKSLTSSVAHAALRLPAEMVEKIIRMTHNGEHKDRMAKVFKEMADLPKCTTCGSVS